MDIYNHELENIKQMLLQFIKSRKIETNKLDTMDALIGFSKDNEDKLIKSSHYNIEEKGVIFGSLTDIKNILETMKVNLISAEERGENPTTAERALELLPNFYNLSPYLSQYVNGKRIDINRLHEASRILHVKADKLGFAKDITKQIEEAKITQKDIEQFIENVNENITQELDSKIIDGDAKI